MAQIANGNEVVTPTRADAALAREVGRKLAAHPAGELRLELKTAGSTEETVTSTVTDGKLIVTSGGFPKNHVAALQADAGFDADVCCLLMSLAFLVERGSLR